jgi:hypothetical protein
MGIAMKTALPVLARIVQERKFIKQLGAIVITCDDTGLVPFSSSNRNSKSGRFYQLVICYFAAIYMCGHDFIIKPFLKE